MQSRLPLALLLAASARYLSSPEDVVWRVIKQLPYSRSLEHLAFGFASVLLGAALFLKIQAGSASNLSAGRRALTGSLQAKRIGPVLPLPGFLLLVFGDLVLSGLTYQQRRLEERGRSPGLFRCQARRPLLRLHDDDRLQHPAKRRTRQRTGRNFGLRLAIRQ